jgi:hypothetical protein
MADEKPILLPFPTPLGFGEPIAYLIVGVNAHGESCIYSSGNPTQNLFFGTQALNYAITGTVVSALGRNLTTTEHWPLTPGGHS